MEVTVQENEMSGRIQFITRPHYLDIHYHLMLVTACTVSFAYVLMKSVNVTLILKQDYSNILINAVCIHNKTP